MAESSLVVTVNVTEAIARLGERLGVVAQEVADALLRGDPNGTKLKGLLSGVQTANKGAVFGRRKETRAERKIESELDQPPKLRRCDCCCGCRGPVETTGFFSEYHLCMNCFARRFVMIAPLSMTAEAMRCRPEPETPFLRAAREALKRGKLIRWIMQCKRRRKHPTYAARLAKLMEES